jgi:hypothetical protein
MRITPAFRMKWLCSSLISVLAEFVYPLPWHAEQFTFFRLTAWKSPRVSSEPSRWTLPPRSGSRHNAVRRCYVESYADKASRPPAFESSADGKLSSCSTSLPCLRCAFIHWSQVHRASIGDVMLGDCHE